MQGGNPVRSACAILVVLIALACGTSSASAATGGTALPSGGTGGVAPVGATGGISPSAVRPPSAPVKKKKPKKRKPRRRRHPVHAPAPAPAPAPVPAPTSDVPSSYLKLYKAAGTRYGVDWRILAAIGKNESDHGR